MDYIDLLLDIEQVAFWELSPLSPDVFFIFCVMLVLIS